VSRMSDRSRFIRKQCHRAHIQASLGIFRNSMPYLEYEVLARDRWRCLKESAPRWEDADS
jgi:hypothetical protein